MKLNECIYVRWIQIVDLNPVEVGGKVTKILAGKAVVHNKEERKVEEETQPPSFKPFWYSTQREQYGLLMYKREPQELSTNVLHSIISVNACVLLRMLARIIRMKWS